MWGCLTPIAAAAIDIDMAIAILKVHPHHGLTGPGGFELPLALFALALLPSQPERAISPVDRVVFPSS